MMLISLHLPKTACSSFYLTLQDYFGSNRILKDYEDYPINTPVFNRNKKALIRCAANAFSSINDINCIHGHFLPLKYLLYGIMTKAKFITWMRDPVERLASHYYYWIRSYDVNTSKSLHKRVVEEQWSLEKFCLSRELRNFYTQFLWGFPLSYFDFIGITEYYDDELSYFSKHFLGRKYSSHKENVNEEKSNIKYVFDATLRKKIVEYHDKDVELYNRALNYRIFRISKEDQVLK